MKKKQMTQLGVALGLVGAIGVGGTLALMTATTEEVKNTFTVGNALVDGDITLDEAHMKNAESGEDGVYSVGRVTDDSVYEYAKLNDSDRVQKNHYLDLQPGDDIYKDPTVHIKEDTADCYVFINVTGIDNLKTKGLTVETTNNYLVQSSESYQWIPVEDSTTRGNDGIYYLASTGENPQPIIVNTETAAQNYMVFESLNAGTAEEMYTTGSNGETVAKITANDNITVKACAVQAKGTDFEGAKEALPDEFTGKVTPSVTPGA